MTTPDNSLAKRLAEALMKAGVTSQVPESDPNPFWAAQQAFYVCEGRTRPDDWREWRQGLTGQPVPRAAYHRKLAILCHRALRRPDMPDDLREAVAYAWGYFACSLTAKIGADAATEEVASG